MTSARQVSRAGLCRAASAAHRECLFLLGVAVFSYLHAFWYACPGEMDALLGPALAVSAPDV